MPGNRYVQVLNTYLTRRLLMAAVLGSLVIALLPTAAWWLAGKSGPADRLQAMFPLFLAFPAMFLGAHVKQQLATHEASLVPGYRTPHLTVAALLFLVPVMFAVLVAPSVNGSIVGHAAVFLLVCLALFKVTADSSPAAGLLVVAVYAPMFVPQLRLAVEQLVAGKLPGLAAFLLSAEAALGVLLFHRLATLTEDDPSFGNVMSMNAWDLKSAEVRRRNRAQLQKSPKVLLSLIEAESRRLDKLTVHPATTRRQRIALLQMASDWPMNLRSMLVMVFVMEGIPLMLPMTLPHLSGISTEPALAVAVSWPIMLSLMLSWMTWLPQSMRQSRLGYESLRPSTRSDWVLENGLATIGNVLKLQAGWLVAQVILLLIFLPSIAGAPVIINGLIFLAGVHIAVFGVVAWISSFGSMLWKFAGAVIVLSILQPSWLAMSSYAVTWNWRIPLFSGICAVVGMAATRVAFRRWCRIDLM